MLDLIRYADTADDASDFPIPKAYRYRNYVIDAFNRDKPYAQFVREQIAENPLPYQDDEQRWKRIITTSCNDLSQNRRQPSRSQAHHHQGYH